jgi:hypothetical protein
MGNLHCLIFWGLGQPRAGPVNLHQNEEEGQGQGNPVDGDNWEDEAMPDQVVPNDAVNAALAPQQEVLFDLNNVPMLEPEEALEDHEEGIGLANLLPHNDAGLQLDPNMDLDLMLLQ